MPWLDDPPCAWTGAPRPATLVAAGWTPSSRCAKSFGLSGTETPRRKQEGGSSQYQRQGQGQKQRHGQAQGQEQQRKDNNNDTVKLKAKNNSGKTTTTTTTTTTTIRTPANTRIPRRCPHPPFPHKKKEHCLFLDRSFIHVTQRFICGTPLSIGCSSVKHSVWRSSPVAAMTSIR